MSLPPLATWRFAVEAGHIAAFARATGDLSGAPPDSAPPTFPVVFSAHILPDLLTGTLGLDPRRSVHGEQSFEHYAPDPGW